LSSWFNLGTIYSKYDKYQKAIIVLKKGLECAPNNIDLWISLMYVYQILQEKNKK
jgi:tetratricopeptide (TPR) repeat protein